MFRTDSSVVCLLPYAYSLVACRACKSSASRRSSGYHTCTPSDGLPVIIPLPVYSRRVIMLINAFLMLGMVGASLCASYQPITCTSDNDCAENFYCYDVSNYCAPCKKEFCSILNREDSYKKCHKEFSDCGKCLPGYEDEILSDGSLRPACILSLPTPPVPSKFTTADSDKLDPFISSTSLLIVITVLSVFSLIFFTYFKKRYRVQQVNRVAEEVVPLTCSPPTYPITNIEDRPPPYNNSYLKPLAPPLYDLPENSLDEPACENSNLSSGSIQSPADCHQDLQSTLGCTKLDNRESSLMGTKDSVKCIGNSEIHTRQVTNCKPVQAGIFRKPNYESGSGQIDELPSDLLPVESYNVQGNEDSLSQNLSIHDESTQPSNWTPTDCLDVAETSNCPSTAEDSAFPGNNQHNKRLSNELSTESEQEAKKKRLCNDSEEESSEMNSFNTPPDDLDAPFRQFRRSINNNNCNKD